MCLIKEIEIWKDIEGYEGLYQVSNWGRVKSLKFGKEKILKPQTDINNYLRLYLFKDGKGKSFSVHRLVASAFVPNPQNYPIINHIDENKQNNNFLNLEWCNYHYNNTYNNIHIKRGEKLKEKYKGKNNPFYGKHHTDESKRKFSKPIIQCTLDGEFIKEWDSITQVKKELNIQSSNICYCCNGKRKTCGGYKWVYKSNYKPKNIQQLEIDFNQRIL